MATDLTPSPDMTLLPLLPLLLTMISLEQLLDSLLKVII